MLKQRILTVKKIIMNQCIVPYSTKSWLLLLLLTNQYHTLTLAASNDIATMTVQIESPTSTFTVKSNTRNNQHFISTDTTSSNAPASNSLVNCFDISFHNDLNVANYTWLQFDLSTSHEMQLELLQNQRSVRVYISSRRQLELLFVIWFISDAPESIEYSIECYDYEQPYLDIANLIANTSYTFCVISQQKDTLIPFDCQPFYIAAMHLKSRDFWISSNEKSSAIMHWFMYLLISLLLGAAMAYIGLRMKPDFLMGSQLVPFSAK